MKKVTTLITLLFLINTLLGQTPKDVKYYFTEASELELIGKILENTSNPYHRVDTTKYKGFTVGENKQVRSSAGLAVLFKTNSTVITVKSEFGWMYEATNTMPLAYKGFDLYIKKDGEWLYAASKAQRRGNENENLVLINNMNTEEKECMIYLPMYSELNSLKIGVEKDSKISKLESSFRHIPKG